MASKKQFQKRAKSTGSHYNPKKMADFLLANASSETRFPNRFLSPVLDGSPKDLTHSYTTHRWIPSPRAIRLSLQMTSRFAPMVPFNFLNHPSFIWATIYILKIITPKQTTNSLCFIPLREMRRHYNHKDNSEGKIL